MADITGIMMTKDEADIIDDVVGRYKECGIQLVVMDDSDDGTYDILKTYDNVYVFRQEDIYGRNREGSGDWMFQATLLEKRRLYGSDNYVFLAMGDEYWYHNPLNVVYDMEIEGATVCIVHSCQFFMHHTDKGKWDFDKHKWKPPYNSMKVRDLLLWYSPGYIAERRIFWDDGHCSYKPKQGFDPLPGGIEWKQYSKNPIIMHYPIRSPIQVLSRAKDRVDRNYQPFYHHSYNKKEEEVFYDSFPGSSKAMKFDGSFGDLEKGLEYLNE